MFARRRAKIERDSPVALAIHDYIKACGPKPDDTYFDGHAEAAWNAGSAIEVLRKYKPESITQPEYAIAT